MTAGESRTPAEQGTASPPAVWPLSVVIPCYNASQTLDRLLTNLERQTLDRRSFEIFVVDDGSTDDSREIAGRHAGVVVLRQDHRGPGEARNLGTHHARGKYVLYLDSDLDVSPDLLRAHVEAFDRQPSLAATGGSVLPGLPLPLFSWVLADHLSSWFNAHPKVHYRSPPEYLPSLNFCIDREIVWSNRGLRWEDGLAHTGEDVVFCHGLRERGLKLAFLPEAVVYHRDRPTMSGYLTHQYRWGYHAPFVRGRLGGMKYGFLFPSSPWAQLFWLPAIVAGYSLLVWKSWLGARPLAATAALPQIVLGRVAYAFGVLRGAKDRRKGLERG